jgi:glycosyltransferase involved in cell wall biosynthesis
MTEGAPHVHVYVITFRRPRLLERALGSLLGQTHVNWTAEVLNDDPSDFRVTQLIGKLRDSRIRLSTPSKHRGGTANFNYAFRSTAAPYAAVLEDDNWWEPRFLEVMIGTLQSRPDIAVAVGNENLWKEQTDGSWVSTGCTIWPDKAGMVQFACSPLDKCGQAKVCNSSMLFRTRDAENWQIPGCVPIDVSEHFRERVIPHPIALVNEPLVNYGETILTHRSKGRKLWAQYQVLLVGSVFSLAHNEDRRRLARALWLDARTTRRLLRNTLLAVGLFIPAARHLWREGTLSEKLLFFRSCIRHPRTLIHASRATQEHRIAWDFLHQGWFAENVRRPPKAPGIDQVDSGKFSA